MKVSSSCRYFRLDIAAILSTLGSQVSLKEWRKGCDIEGGLPMRGRTLHSPGQLAVTR